MIAIPSGFSPEDYLALERDHTVRHEYRRGLVYAMAGGRDGHSLWSSRPLSQTLHLFHRQRKRLGNLFDG